MLEAEKKAAADKAAKLEAEKKAAADEAAKLEAEKKAAADDAAKLEAEKKAAAGASPLGRHRPLPNQHTPTHLSPSRTRHLKPVRTPVAILGSLGVCIYVPASRHWLISYSPIHLT